jgi:hypothetical protein
MLNVVSPGPVDTPLHRERASDPDLGAASRALVLPVGRLGTADEIASLMEFLLGPEARFFCGSFITCDGGLDAQRRSEDSPSSFVPAGPRLSEDGYLKSAAAPPPRDLTRREDGRRVL